MTLKTFLNAAGFLEKVNGPWVEGRFNNSTATAEIVNRILTLWPSVQPGPTTPDGEVLVGPGRLTESPWAEINRSGYRQESRSNLTASWGLEQDMGFLTKGLSTKLLLSFDTRSIYNLGGQKQHQYWVQVIDPNTQTSDGRDSVYYQRTRTDFNNTPLRTSTSSTFQSFYDIQWHLNYARTFGEKHAFTGLILAQQQSLIKPSDNLPFNVRGLATRMTYAFEDRYFAEFNAGFNGSEQFASGRRYGFFPSVSAGWNVHEESFFRDVRSTINLLKFRGSYGTVGGDKLGSRRFLYLDDIQRESGSYSATLARGGRIAESFFGNSIVKWEVAEKQNLGIEIGLFNQLTLTADFFKERRDNVLINRGTIPLFVGVSADAMAPANLGIIENKGYELQLDYSKVIRPDFSVLAKINFNHAQNIALFSDEVLLDEDYAFRYRTTGYQIGQQWGYHSLGFFNSEAEIVESGLTYQGQSPRPGDLIYEDLNGDKIIDQRDIMPIGESALPRYNWGAAVSVSFKRFDFSVLFQGAFGVTGQFNSWEIDDFRSRHAHAWTPERAANGYNILYPALTLSSSPSSRSNTFFNEDKSFVRLKNAELGYNFGGGLIDKLGMKNLRVYCNGLNIFTWDNMVQKDWDPELGSTSSFPVYRVMNFGVNATF